MTAADLDEYINAPCCPGAFQALAEELQRLPMRKNPPKWTRPQGPRKKHESDYSKLTPLGPSEEENETE